MLPVPEGVCHVPLPARNVVVPPGGETIVVPWILATVSDVGEVPEMSPPADAPEVIRPVGGWTWSALGAFVLDPADADPASCLMSPAALSRMTAPCVLVVAA